ncbi:hypothetical protein D3C77_388350 [compost metagenome]
MGLLQMNAVGARLFPHIADRIQPHIISPFLQIMQQDIHHADQHLWISKIQVNLISAKGSPDMFDFPIGTGEGG